jgi:hypothetical protein
MAMISPSPPRKEILERPEPLHEVLKNDKDDCLPCKIMGKPLTQFLAQDLTNCFVGGSAFIGLGAYSYFSGHNQLKLQQAKILKSKSIIGFKGRQTGITGTALALAGLGVWRLVN